jgi:hypothetical protein
MGFSINDVGVRGQRQRREGEEQRDCACGRDPEDGRGEMSVLPEPELERDGTFVHLMSDNLRRDQVLTTAAGLRPAPSTSGI